MGSMSQPGRRWSLGFVGVEGLGFRVYGYGVLAEFVLVFFCRSLSACGFLVGWVYLGILRVGTAVYWRAPKDMHFRINRVGLQLATAPQKHAAWKLSGLG